MSRANRVPKPKRGSRGRRPAKLTATPNVGARDDNSLRGATPHPEPTACAPRRRSAKGLAMPAATPPAGNYSEDAAVVAKPLRSARPRRRAAAPPKPVMQARDGNCSEAGHPTIDNLRRHASPDASGGADQVTLSQKAAAPPHASAFERLGIIAAAVDDLERTRIALSGRAGAFVRNGAREDDPVVVGALGWAAAVEMAERKAVKAMGECLRDETPIGPRVDETHGLGLKAVARFLGVVGHPRWRRVWSEPDAEGVRKLVGYAPRTVSQLWAYCGLDVRDGRAPRRAKGEKGNWNAIARKRAYCMADPCMKQRACPYRAVYDAARAKHAEAEITDGHRHNRAMRAVMKAIVKDLWVWAGGQVQTENHCGRAPATTAQAQS